MIRFLFFIVFAANQLYSNEIYDKIRNNGDKINTLSLKIVQYIETNDESKNFLNANIFYKKENKFRVNYIQNKIDYIYNGNKLFVHDIKNNKLLLNSTSYDFGLKIIQFFKMDDRLLEKEYMLTSFWEEKDSFVIIWLEKNTNYKVILYFSKKTLLPEKIIWDKNFMKFVVKIKSISINIKIIDDFFNFIPDKNTEIINL